MTHAGGLIAGIALSHSQIPTEVQYLKDQSVQAVNSTGWFPLLFILFHAFTLGGGTYTGIEAVSNGIPILRGRRPNSQADDALHGGFARAHCRRHSLC